MNEEKVNILVVDDRTEKVLALEAVLEELQQNVVRAYSGREALRALLQDEFAVVLLDVNMPGMDGFETASLIRQRKATRDVPIIFVTAYGDEDHLTQGYSLGAVDYIQTPVVPEVLKTKVSVFVDLYRKTDQIRRQAQSLRRRAQQMQKLASASAAINSALSTEALLQTITDVARDVVSSHQAITLFLLNANASRSRPRTQSASSYSDKYSDWRGKPLELDGVAKSVVAQSRTTTRMTVAELRDHPDWEIVSALSIPPIVSGMIAAPLTGRDGTNLGVIYLADRIEGEFTSEDEAILAQLGQMASIALENAIFAEERETNRIKDEFLSTLSHELRTPLSAILGWTQLLRMEELNEETAYGVDVIERNAKAQTKLVEDMLDVSRITTGKLKLNKRPMQLSKVIHAAIDAVRPSADEKQIAITSRVVEQDDCLQGDPDRLQQVIWNLLCNAVKFTPASGHVDVRMQRLDEMLRISVSDDGPGINPRFLPRVFDRFRQGDSTSTRDHGGLGIGLTIVRHIVELHGGRVQADSAGEGCGATFVVELPAPITARPPQEPGAASAPKDVAAGIDLSGVRVLIVDDEPDAREVAAQMLRRANAIVELASSAQEALKGIARSRPHVLITDIAMPQCDGYELIRTVRELDRSMEHPLPAVALTAYASGEDRARAAAAGFNYHLAKPFEAATLLSVVAKLAVNGASQPAVHVS